jgi:hypothetical protein
MASAFVDLLAVFFPVVMFQRAEKGEQIGEHGDPTGGSLTDSLYVRHVDFLTFRVVVFVVRLKFK